LKQLENNANLWFQIIFSQFNFHLSYHVIIMYATHLFWRFSENANIPFNQAYKHRGYLISNVTHKARSFWESEQM